MNSLLVGAAFLAWLALGSRFYGRRISNRLIGPNDDNPVPSVAQRDGVDFQPTPAPVLFGHHFSSIAGAGPIVGPLIGVAAFGWLPSLLWIALGSVFIGAVHDYTALMASVRNRGHSVGEIAEQTLGRRARAVLSIFLWCALVLVIAVFGILTAKTFISQPSIVLPTFGLILLAAVFGRLVLRGGLPLLPSTLAALLLLGLLIWLGEMLPLQLPETVLGAPAVTAWFWILMIYCVAASVMPVWLLLQPRDYISTWILYLGLAGAFLGLIFAHPAIHSPAVASLNTARGPIFPMLFVLIACGAISGFHALVGSGTSSKQLARESDGLKVGYGAMILEAALAGLVVLIAAAALPWDAGSAPAAGSLQHLMTSGGGAIMAFATGLGALVDRVPLLTASAGLFFGILMINAFVMTTLDTSTRLARFILQEMGSSTPVLRGRWPATVITVLAAGWLGASGSYTQIWPIFGATNQLVAALALIVISSWLVGTRRPRRFTLVPALFMLVTSVTALLWQVRGFLRDGRTALAIVAAVLVVLAMFIAWEARGLLKPGPASETAKSGRTP